MNQEKQLDDTAADAAAGKQQQQQDNDGIHRTNSSSPRSSGGSPSNQTNPARRPSPPNASATTTATTTTTARNSQGKTKRIPRGRVKRNTANKAAAADSAEEVAASSNGRNTNKVEQLTGATEKSNNTPGAVAVDISTGGATVSGDGNQILSNLESDILAKGGGNHSTLSPQQQQRISSPSNNKSKQSLNQFEQDIVAKSSNGGTGTTRPGAVAVNASGNSSLSRLENEITTKSDTRGDNTAATSTAPGAVAVSGSGTSSSLSKLEHDIMTKSSSSTSPRSSSQIMQDHNEKRRLGGTNNSPRATKPGAVAVSSGGSGNSAGTVAPDSLSGFERDLASKAQQTSSPNSITQQQRKSPAGGGMTQMNQFEQDVRAKASAAGVSRSEGGAAATKPGAVAVHYGGGSNQNNGSSSLSQLERDILSKNNNGDNMSPKGATSPSTPSASTLEKRGMSATTPNTGTTRPGAVAVSASGRDRLSALEQDLATTKGGQVIASAQSSTPIGEYGNHRLSQLERDVITKASASSSSPGKATTVPGAVAVRSSPKGEAGAALTQMEQDVINKSNSVPSSNTKTSPRKVGISNTGATKPGAVAVRGSGLSGLSNLEQDIARKTANVDNIQGNENNLNQLERDVIAKSNAGTAIAAGNGPRALSQLEDDITTKMSSTSPRMDTTSQNIPGKMSLDRDTEIKRKLGQDSSSHGAVRPGAVAVNGSGMDSLTGLDRDIAPKMQAEGSVGDGRNQLNRLEQDARTKASESAARGAATATSRPGAVAVSGSGASALSQIEEDIMRKSEASSAKMASRSPSTGLHQLERDLATKISISDQREGNTKPGAVAVGGPGLSNLSQMECDIASKNQSFAPASQKQNGEAFEGEGSRQLTQMELDARAKAAAFRPGAVPMNSSGLPTNLSGLERDIIYTSVGQGVESNYGMSLPTGNNQLSQLERDLVTKSSSKRTGSSTQQPGATSVEPSGSERLTILEQDVAAKSSVGSSANMKPGAVPVSKGSHLASVEDEVVSKNAGAAMYHGMHQHYPTQEAVKAQSAGGNSLSQMERDLMAKNVRKSQGANVPGSFSEISGLSQPEQQVVRKFATGHDEKNISLRATAQVNDSQPESANHQGLISSLGLLEDLIFAKSDPDSSPSAASNQFNQSGYGATQNLGYNSTQNAKVSSNERSDVNQDRGMYRAGAHAYKKPNEAVVGDPVAIGGLVALGNPVAIGQIQPDVQPDVPQDNNGIPDDGAAIEMQSFGHIEAAVSLPNPEMHPEGYIGQEMSPGNYYDGGVIYASGYGSQDFPGVTAGIEAFVADTVVDATGVAVIESEDEEEDKLARSRQNRRFCIGGIIAVIIIIAIIVPVVVMLGPNDEGDSVPTVKEPTAMPTMAPTAMPTLAPTSTAFVDLVNDLAQLQISGEEAFASRDSPQYQAAQWLADSDTFVTGHSLTVNDPKFLQRYALAVMYFALGGEQWEICGRTHETCGSDDTVNSWLSAADDCTWFGLTCEEIDGERDVNLGLLQRFEFSSTDPDRDYVSSEDYTPLVGELPPETKLLSNLVDFIIYGYEVSGTLSGHFSEARMLQDLILSNTTLEGTIPEELALQNPNLRKLYLSDNNFNSTIPISLGSLMFLEDLQVDGNKLSGTLPNELFSSLTMLSVLELQENNFNGTIPDNLYSLSSLRVLRIDGNPITDTISTEIANLQRLNELHLGSSNIGGTIPNSLYNLTRLQILDLSRGKFNGTVSSDIGFLNNTLKKLYLQENQFAGPIPDTLGQFGILEFLLLYKNDLTGTIPEQLCSRRGNAAGMLIEMRVDCSGVTCTCCNKCIN